MHAEPKTLSRSGGPNVSTGAGMCAVILLGLMLGACAARGPAPGAADAATSAAGLQGPRYTDADVRFVQGMLAHHGQALVMTALVEERTDTRSLRLLSERIEVSQHDEIQQMEQWLRARGVEVPSWEGGHGSHSAHHDGMPGLLSEAQLARLAEARGAEFDRLFLEFMIQHHQGALTMVDALLATPSSGQEVDIFRIASEIAADQAAEIQRMRRLLAALP